jgi:hypothetical protein
MNDLPPHGVANRSANHLRVEDRKGQQNDRQDDRATYGYQSAAHPTGR